MDQVIQEINTYYEDGARKLHNMINKIFNKYYSGTNGKDMEEFYGIGTDVLTEIWEKGTYDSTKGDFDGYVYRAISMAIIDEFKNRNRDKRTSKIFLLDEHGDKVLDEKTGKPIKIPLSDIRLDAPVKEGENTTYGDMLQSDFNMDNILEKKCVYEDERVEKFLDSLPKTTRRIIEMKMSEIPISEIKKKLGLSEKEYCNHMNSVRINENIALFTKTSNRYIEEDNAMNNIIPIDVTDDHRMDKFPLGSLLDDMRDGKINKKHILQRKPFQWTERQKNKFLTRILNGQPVPEIVICEQTIKGKKKSHLIDGLQRLSYSELFRADGIVVKIDGAEFYEIPYKEYKYDSDGNILLDEDGDALFEEKIFNVLGKKFSDFPQFLKDRFNKFNINVTTYFNCTDDQIAYHIRNYNNQEGMNKSQYEFTGMDIHVAERIKTISDRHSFFKDTCGKYTEKNKTKGDLDKVVVESIMAINFINDWKKEVKDSFAFVNDNVTDYMFDSFEDNLGRLSKIIDKEVKNMFTVVNSPVWFSVFEKFKKLNLPDERFKDFIKYVSDYMDDLKVNGKSFADIYKSRNTRDKATIIGKVDGLTILMYEFLHIDENTVNEEDSRGDLESFISENVGIDKETVINDISLYNETLDDLEENTIKLDSKLLDEQNRFSLLAMVAYSYAKDIDLDEWMSEYAKKNNTYFMDQKKNYLHMKENLNKFINIKNEKSA